MFQERTKYGAELDLCYHVRLHELHARLLRRTRIGIALFSALCGTAAIANAIAGIPWLNSAMGFAIGAAGLADVICGIGDKAVAHERLRQRFVELQAKQARLGIEGLDAEIARISIDDPGEFESLRKPAYNDVVCTFGHADDQLPLTTRLERFMRAVA